MLASLTAIVLFETAGGLLQTWLQLPIPGPVIGMALLLAALIGQDRLPEGLDRIASGLLSYLPMMFVPAGVGVMAHFDLIRAEWPIIAVALAASSVLAIVVTATTMRAVERTQQVLRETARQQTAKQTAKGVQ